MVLAGLSSLVPSMAQNAQNPQRLRARVAASTIKNGRPTDIYILSANGPTVQFVESRESQEVLQQMASAFKTLYILKRTTCGCQGGYGKPEVPGSPQQIPRSGE